MNLACRMRHHNRLVSQLAALIALFLGGISVADAALPNANGVTAASDPELVRDLGLANNAMKSGNLALALIELKNAVRLAPQNGAVRTQLGIALLQSGDAATAERELRQARTDRGPDQFILPALFEAMLARGETKELLAQFPDPGPQNRGSLAPDILRARAMALQSLGQSAVANSAMDRSLALRRDGVGLLTRAQLAWQQGDKKLAGQLVDQSLKAAPTNGGALLLKLELTRESGDKQKAVAQANHLVQLNPRSVLARVVRIEALIESNLDAKAKEDVDTILAQSPGLPIGVFYRALLRARAGDAKGAWALARDLPPQFVQAQPRIAIVIAGMAILSGNFESGGAILSGVLARDPKNIDARVRLAALRVQQHSPQDALNILSPLKDSHDSKTLALLADASLKLGQYSQAIDYLQRANSAGGNDLLTRQLAATELQAGRTEQGIQELKALAAREPGNVDVGGQLIAALVQQRQYDDALSVADKLADSGVKGPVPAFYRGQVLIARGDLASAIVSFTRSLESDPKFTPSLYYRAQAEAAQADTEHASADLQHVLAIDPKNVLALIKEADIAAQDDRDSQVTALLNKAILVAPANPMPRLALANYQFLGRDYRGAEATLSSLFKSSPDNSDGLVLSGKVQLAAGMRDQAIATYRKLASKNPQSAQAQILLADLLSQSGDRSGAVDALNAAIRLAPASSQPRAMLASIQAASGSPDKALATVHDFAVAYPGTDADLLLANVLVNLKRNSEAISVLTKSLATKPNGAVAVRLGQVLMSTGNSKKALAVLTSWLATNPNDAGVRREYAGLLIVAGDQAGARREFEKVLGQAPNDPVALNDLAWLIQKENPARAISMASHAAKLAPRASDIADTLGWLEFQGKDRQAALSDLQRAHDLDSNDPEISYHLALALDAAGKRADAKALLRSLLSRNVNFADIESARQLSAHW